MEEKKITDSFGHGLTYLGIKRRIVVDIKSLMDLHFLSMSYWKIIQLSIKVLLFYYNLNAHLHSSFYCNF